MKRHRKKLIIMKFLLKICFSFILILINVGCANSFLKEQGPFLREYHQGQLLQAESRLNCLVSDDPRQQKTAVSKEHTWLLLERATTRFAQGNVDAAVGDYAKVIDALMGYSPCDAREQLIQIALQDEVKDYDLSDFEQNLVRLYFAFALLHQNDESNARAILRQSEDYQLDQIDAYAHHPFMKNYAVNPNPFTKYLFSLLLKRQGDESNARILLQQAQCLHLVPNHQANNATVLIVCHNGNAPYKVSTTCHSSVASAAAIEALLSSSGVQPAYSTLTGIPIPKLQNWPYSDPQPVNACIDEDHKRLFPIYSVRQAAEMELQQKTPFIAARGAVRMLLRRATVGYCAKQNPHLGMMADLIALCANAKTRADTRSWTTLPAQLDVAHFEVGPGVKQLSLDLFQGSVFSRETIALNLSKNDLCIIHIFRIHPGVVTIVIPPRFLN